MIFSDLFYAAFGDDFTALCAAFGPHIDDVVAVFDDVHVVLDNKDRVAKIYEMVQYAHEPIDVGEMQPRSRLVEDIKRLNG